MQCLSLRLGEGAAVDYLMRCARAQEGLAALGTPETIEARLRAMMELPDESVEDYVAHHCGDDGFDCDLLRAVADANRRWGAQTGLGHAELIDDWLALTPIERAASLPELRKIVLTDKGTLARLAGQTKAEPHYESHAGRLADLVGDLLRVQNAARLACDMAAGLRAGQAFAGRTPSAKRAAGVADFDDLIRWTRELLAQPGMGEWVRYKLDQRTDHILVDEAQDTNEAQWDIVARWSRNISAARPRPSGAFAPYSWSAISSRRSTASRAPIRANSTKMRARCKRAAVGGAADAERRRRRVPRPVDQRQLSFGAGDARCRRCA